MRGGAIPLLVWGSLIALLLALCWVWTGDTIQVASFGFTVVTVIGWVVVLTLRRPRQALRRGPPEPLQEPEAVPSASFGSVLLAVGAASAVFGLAFGHFLIYFGAGVMVVALGAIVREHRAERRARRAGRRGERG